MKSRHKKTLLSQYYRRILAERLKEVKTFTPVVLKKRRGRPSKNKDESKHLIEDQSESINPELSHPEKLKLRAEFKHLYVIEELPLMKILNSLAAKFRLTYNQTYYALQGEF